MISYYILSYVDSKLHNAMNKLTPDRPVKAVGRAALTVVALAVALCVGAAFMVGAG